MKKIILLFFVILTLSISVAHAKPLENWVTKTVWPDSNGWIYAVGKAHYSHSSTEEFLNSQSQATIMAIDLIKNYLKADELKGFQVIDFAYSASQYYVLAAVPASMNPKHKETKALPWEWDFNKVLEDTEPDIAKALKITGVKSLETVPLDWATYYNHDQPKKSVFIVDQTLYSIGTGQIINNDENTANATAYQEAKLNMMNTVSDAQTELIESGNYANVITRLDQTKSHIYNAKIQDIKKVNNTKYVLIKVSLNDL